MLNSDERRKLESIIRRGISHPDEIPYFLDNLYTLIIDDYEKRKTLIESGQDEIIEMGGFLNTPKFFVTRHAIFNVNLLEKMFSYLRVSDVNAARYWMSEENILLAKNLRKGVSDSNNLNEYNMFVLNSDKIIDELILDIEKSNNHRKNK